MPRTLQVDVAVIGAGSAGLGARRTAEKHGASTVLIESGPYGTTCARVGCMPSKLLIAAADAAHHMREAALFGVHGEPAIDEAAVFERVRRERERFVGFVVDATERIPEERRLRGRARFVGPTALMVDDHTRVEAKAVVVATGSSPWIPPPLRPVAEHLLDNDGVFELTAVPKRLAVVGTGVIGMELGQALARLGSKVTFFSIDDRIGPLTDPAVRATVRDDLGAELDIRLHTAVSSAEKVDGGVRLTWPDADAAGGERSEVFTHVLAATGRRPNLDLGLEKAGIDVPKGGVPAFDDYTMQIGKSGVFLAGDVDNDRPLLHEASDEGRIAGHNAARHVRHGPGSARRHARRTPLGVVFTDPQMAIVGQSWAALQGSAFEAGEVSYDDQGRARVMGRNKGRVRIYGDAETGLLLGAEMFGPDVEHTAHLLAWAIQSRLTVVEALRMPFYHPVVEEGIRTALRDLAAKLHLADPIELKCIDCGPGS